MVSQIIESLCCVNWNVFFCLRYDYRIKYLNLKKTRSQNALSLEDVHRLWIPFLVFDNTEKNEATKVKWNIRLS